MIDPSQAAILAVGRVRPIAVVDAKGTLDTGRGVKLSSSCDHRVLTGMQGAEFLAAVKAQLEDPQVWVD